MTQELTGSPGAGGQGTSVPGGWRAMGLQAPCLHPCQALSSLESRGSAGNLLALLLVSKQAGAPHLPPDLLAIPPPQSPAGVVCWAATPERGTWLQSSGARGSEGSGIQRPRFQAPQRPPGLGSSPLAPLTSGPEYLRPAPACAL